MDDEISQGSDDDARLPPMLRPRHGRWRVMLTLAALAGAAVAGAVVLASQDGRPASPARPSAPPSALNALVPGPSYSASVTIIQASASAVPAPLTTVMPAPGTMLVSCPASQYMQRSSDWRQQSLQVGPVVFLDSKLTGYVHLGRPADAGADLPGQSPLTAATPINVEVGPSETVVLKPAAGTSGYFRFADGFNFNGPVPLPPGDTGFTLVGCPPGASGQDDGMTTYSLAYSITPDRNVPVEIWTSPSAKPVWLTITIPT